MRKLTVLIFKELLLFFTSPIFYVAAFIFCLLEGYFFYNSLSYFHIMSFQVARNPGLVFEGNLMNMVLTPLFYQIGILMLLISPLLTMRLYAEEKRSGTLEILFTMPVKDSVVLIAKCSATYLLFALIIILSGVPVLFFLNHIGEIDWGIVFSSLLGLALMEAAFITVGCFLSTITENQIVAAVIGFGIFLLSWVVNWSISYANPPVAKILKYFSLFVHFDNFVRGLIDLRSLAFYLFIILIFFIAARRTIEYRRIQG
jgi:ABC-2 type transport system permease protein